MKHKLPELKYEFNALEPYIDTKTMEIHYTKHHRTYIDKLNAALEKYPELQKANPQELITNLDKIPKEIRDDVKNNYGGHLNHSFFWKILKKDVEINGEILEAIEKEFESFQNFKDIFKNSAMKLFGSGWVWLVLNKNKLEIINTPNQDNPLTQGKIPLLSVDLWEHAYYLKYQNRRADYIDAFFHVINWTNVNKNYLNALKEWKKSY